MNLDAALELLSRDFATPLDVAELALCLARDEFADLDVEAYLGEVDAMAHEARNYVRGNLSQRVSGLCRYLFHEMGFRGNTRDYYDPRNSYFHLVLERRIGIPITLSTIMMAVGARVGLGVEGVGLPGHFVVKVSAADQEILVDPFHGGRLLSAGDCANLVRQVTGQEFSAGSLDLRPLPLGLVVWRLLNNLKRIYLERKDFPRALRIMERMRQLNPHDLAHRRDLGTGFLHAGRPGKAIVHLAAYLAAFPDADDAEVVRLLLKEARAVIAELN